VAASILQVTDPHIGADWHPGDPLDTLRAVLAAVRVLPQRPAVALMTGDLTNGGDEQDYAALTALLAEELELPLHVLPGNHDDRAALRRHFDLAGEAAEPIQYAVELDGLRVLMLDTTIPGEEASGALDRERLEWISGELTARPEVPTILAMHHPPFLAGLPGMDRYALAAEAREAIARLVSGHPQIRGTIAGHVHRTMTTVVGGRPSMTAPSTYCQLRLDFEKRTLDMVPEPVGFVIHTLVEGRLVSTLQTLPVTAA
jgi:3',5'-cyclic AMP phosphodiesterase CpdA